MLKSLIDYLVQDLGVQPNVAVTIILSLFTFSLGFIVTWTVAAFSKWVKRRNYKKSLKIVIRSFLESCQNQSLKLEPFSSNKGFLHGENYNIPIMSIFGQNYLSSLDLKVFIENFSSIFKKNRAQEISDLFKIVDTVKTIRENHREQMRAYHSVYDENLKLYNENLSNIRKLHNDIALEHNSKTLEAPLANYISSIIITFNKWIGNGANTNVHTTNTEIVTPLFENILTIPPNTISRKIIEYCMECRAAVVELTNIDEYMKSEVEIFKKIHEESYKRGMLIFKKW